MNHPLFKSLRMEYEKTPYIKKKQEELTLKKNRDNISSIKCGPYSEKQMKIMK